MKKLLIMAMACLLSFSAMANETDDQKITPLFFFSTDSDDFDVFRKGIQYTYKYKDNFWHGIQVDTTSYNSPSWSDDIQSAYYVFKHKYEKGSVSGKLGLNDQNVFVGDFDYTRPLNKHFEGNVFAERQIVDSELGIQDKVYYNMFGGSLSYDSLERFSAAVVYAHQDINDGNNREHYRGRLSYTLSKEYGIHAHIRGKYFESSMPTRGIYFNPEQYERYMAGLSWRRWYNDGSMFNIGAYYGTEQVKWTPSNSVQYYELQYIKPLSDRWFLNINGGAIVNSNAYEYQYINATLSYTF